MNKQLFHSKLPSTGTTIFTTMSALASQHGAINLGQGFPGFAIDPLLGELVKKHIDQGCNQYAPMAGVPVLRQRIAQKMLALYGREYDFNNEVTITAGATQAIFTTISALVRAGDEVILFAPAYDCYAPAIELNGGVPVWIELTYPHYRIPWNEVRQHVNERTKLIIINSPHNPASAVWNESDLMELEKTVDGTGIIVLSDEVYEHLVFDGQLHHSCATRPLLAGRSLLVYSFGKTFHITGWKVGYIVAPEWLMTEFRKVHQYNVFSVNTPVQHALAEYLEDKTRWNQLAVFFQRKRDLFLQQLKGSGFEYEPAKGTYFQLLGYAAISNKPDTEFACTLTEKFKVTGIPCSVFYPSQRQDHVLRFCFAKNDEELINAAARLRQVTV